MGSEGWCLLVCLALSGAADAVERQWRAVDVILDCFLMGEGGHRGGFAISENMVKALLVLKQVPVPDDGSLEGLTDFQGGTLAEDDPLITFEASVNLIQIPQAKALLHADCSGKEVTCEISRYFLQARPKATVETAAWFITNVVVSGEGPSISMVMKTLGDAENGAVLHPMLKLPLSPQGTVRTEVEFQVTTQTPSLNLLLGSSASLHCGFSMAPGLGITSVEWRLQHKGSGHLVYRWTTGQGQAKREGATLEPQQLLTAGDASLTLPSLTLKDEGTYICEITTSLYRAQQIIQLDVQVTCGNRTPLCRASRWTPHHHCPPAAWRLTEEGTSASTTCSYVQQEKALGSSAAPVMPVGFYFSSSLPAAPKVLLSLASEALPPTLLCSVTGYYPLDVTVTWIREELGGAPAPVSGASFSSLRQSMAGTYSISSSLTAEPGSVGATYTCQVTHVSLEEPLGANTWVAPPEQRTAFGVLFASSLFLLALLFLGLQRRQATSPRPARTPRHSG
ncbi:tapasin-related protein isoform X1 [Delphinapterus leucas]|uniref:Tapasin-related protein n=1 Tax=Delphinapterus leucas TaxID=9749 RepID=A0A2Y9NP23_DELLE|nr:tapasin-related protein isoform X1 [Delphinapterus leucas]